MNAGAVTMMLNGRSTKLVSDANGWHAVGDEKLRIESINETNAALANGARGQEYWKVTTQDGTQYFFGRHKRYAGDTAATNSVLTEPVIHNNVGEPCHAAPGWCQEAYRWNLDYVVDPRLNTMTLFYNKFQGKTGFNGTSVLLYDLSATLDRIEYGTRQGTEAAAAAPMRVTFGYGERCWTSCTWPTSGYADTPGDLFCATTATTCANVKTPMHFTRYRLSTVTTQVYASAWRNVDKWDLDQTFLTSGDYITPAGDDTAPNLWLNGLTHTGYAADGVTTQAEPQTTFGGERKANRTDWSDALGMAPFMHWRIKYVYNGAGGQTTVNYADTDCVNQAPKVNSDSNPFRCFPQFYKGPASESAFGYFNKYVVSSVVETDLTGGSPDETTSYAYSTEGSLDAALWGHDDVDLADVTYTSWADWRGYPTVTTTHGTVTGQQTVSKSTYHRGLLGDAKKNGTDTAVLFDQRQSFTLEPLQPASAIPVAIAGGLNANRLCLDIVNYGTANGTAIQSYYCTGDWNQVWQRLTDGTNAIKNPQSGKCLDVYGGGTANGTHVQLYTCTNVPAQQWLRQPDGSLKNVGSGRCLDINNYSTLPIGSVEIYDCHGYSNQQWMPTNTGALQNVQGNRCLDATGGGTVNGTTIQNYGCAWNDNQGNQVWQLETDGTVRNPSSGRCLTVNASGTTNGTGTYLWDCTAAPKQIWQAQTDGSLKNPSTNRCLDSGDSSAPNAVVFIYDCNGNLSQQWVARTPDKAALNGNVRTETTIDNAAVTGYTVHSYAVTQTGTRAAYTTTGATVRAYLTRENQTKTGTRIAANNSWRWAQTDTTFDSYGLPTDVSDRGDITTATDDTCTHTDYARTVNASTYLVDFPSQLVTTDCAASPSGANFLEGTQKQYDSGIVGAGPSLGLVTQVNALANVAGTTLTWDKQSTGSYDPYGRPYDTFDALVHKTTTRYTPATGGPVTAVTVTNPKLQPRVTTVEPGHGVTTSVLDISGQTTTAQYDPLGRLTKVWQPGRATNLTPNTEYGYALSVAAPNVLTTKVLAPSGNQITSTDLYDGRLRQRQHQTLAAQAKGGRIVSDTQYDARGLASQQTTFWDNTTAPGTALAGFTNTAVQQQTRTTYDTLERPTAVGLYAADVLKWQTTTSYDGDSTTVVPPAGGTPTKKTIDVGGNIVELRQYTAGSIGGASQATTYTYDRLNRLTKVSDPAANAWTATYDRLGRKTASTDPDSGAMSYGYDAAGRLTSTTDARNITLAYSYDDLNRKTAVFDGTTGGFKRAEWTYDTVRVGSLSNAKRYIGALTYTSAVDSYDAQGRPTSLTTTLPVTSTLPSDGPYTVGTTYNVDGSIASKTYPSAGGLAAETVSYTYDTTGRPLGMAGAETYVADTSYYGFGPVFQQVLGSGTKKIRRTATIDEATGRTTGSLTETQNQTVTTNWDERLNQTYGFDNAGNVTSIKETSAATVVANECFTYDGLRQLTEAWATTAAACQTTPSQAIVGGADAYWTSYTYQLTTGNRTGETKHATGGNTVRTYAYPPSGATSIRPHTISNVAISGAATGTDSYTYGAIGNTATRSIAGGPNQTLTWDNEGLVSSITAGTATTTYTYDADGNRLAAVDPTGTTVYLPGFELRKQGSTVTCTRYYNDVASRTPTGLVWLSNDQHGTAGLAITATTLATTRRRLDPFGNPRSTLPTWPNVRGFVNGTTDGTGLTHLGARDYESTTGRFISDDSVTDPTDPLQINGYVYAGANPATNSDPNGLRTCSGPEDCGQGLGGTKEDYSHGNPFWGNGVDKKHSANNKKVCGGSCYRGKPIKVALTPSVQEQLCVGMTARACEATMAKYNQPQPKKMVAAAGRVSGSTGGFSEDTTVGLCFNAGAALVFNTSGEICLHGDKKGMFLTATGATPPNNIEPINWADGSYGMAAGGGVKLEFSNAQKPSDLSGPFSYWDGNLGPVQFGDAWGTADGHDVNVSSLGYSAGVPIGGSGGISRTHVFGYLFNW